MSEHGRGMANDAARDGELDLASVGRALARKKWWLLGPALAVAALTFVGVNLIAPRYKSEARILLEGRENVFFRPEADRNNIDRDRTVDPEAVTSQVQLALSRDVARQVIKELKLGERPEFDSALRGVSLLRYTLGMLGLAKDPLSMSQEERVLEAYSERLTVFPVDKSRVITIEFQSADPEFAAKAANTVADSYIAALQGARRDQTRAAGKWLSGEIDVLRKRVAEAEAKVEEFRSKTNLFIGTNNTTLSNQTLGESNRDLAAARSQKAELEAKARVVRDLIKRGGPLESSAVFDNDRIRRLVEQLVAARGQLAEQSSTLGDRHPRINELKAQIAALERQIRTEAQSVAQSLENDAKMAGERVAQLSAGLTELKQQAASTNSEDVELRAREREAKALRDLLESYLAKYREATARGDSLSEGPADARIISRAVVSNTPYFPKKLPIVLIATFATLFISAGFVTSGELLAGNVYRAGVPAPVEPAAPVVPAAPVAAEPAAPVRKRRWGRAKAEPAVPVEPVAPPIPAPAADEMTIDDIAQALREAGADGKRIAVIGAAPQAGATSNAVAIARALARDARVVLLDLALERPALATIAIDARTPGIADLVRGAASFAQIITRDRFSRVQIVPAGRVGSDAGMIFMSERLAVAVEALSRSYDHVVIDAGSAPYIPADRIAKLAPCAVLVAHDVPAADAEAVRGALANSGFTDIAVYTGTAPAPDLAGSRGVAA